MEQLNFVRSPRYSYERNCTLGKLHKNARTPNASVVWESKVARHAHHLGEMLGYGCDAMSGPLLDRRALASVRTSFPFVTCGPVGEQPEKYCPLRAEAAVLRLSVKVTITPYWN